MNEIIQFFLPLWYLYLGMVAFSAVFFVSMLLLGKNIPDIRTKINEVGFPQLLIISILISFLWPKTLPDLFKYLRGV